jgi:hypothetical protein
MSKGFLRFLRRNTIALLALFLALGGTTYAASTALIAKNSVASPQVVNGSLGTTDLSKKARKSLRGVRGARGLPGAKGATGAQGVQGIQGPAGPFPGVLPSGKTIRGQYGIYDRATAAAEYQYEAISFGFTLSAPPTIHYIKTGTAPPAGCPGTVSSPEADPGNLCVYESSFVTNVGTDRNAWVPIGSATGTFGALVYTSSSAAGAYYTFGTWAVTSP